MPKRVGIGVDIGSSAVRAAEVVVDGHRRVLRRFCQVGLPVGAVVEGEVQDRAAVAAALKRLWQHGGFAKKRVVIGFGSQRAMVRAVEMPAMSDVELRSALRFKIGEFLPIPVEQAVVDFAPLAPEEGGNGGRKVLLVAAQREVVLDEVAAVEAAGLRVEAVDSSSLALLRAVDDPRGQAPTAPSGGGWEAVIGIGAELMTVAVREGGVARFVRTVALMGPGKSEDGSGTRGAVPGIGERVRTSRAGSSTAVAVEAGQRGRVEVIVSEVRSSLEYLLSQNGTRQFERALLTGGGAMLPGVTDALAGALGLPVSLAGQPVELDRSKLGLEEDALQRASCRWLPAIGLALWGTDVYGKLSLLPPEVIARRQERRVLAGAAAGVVLVGAVLGTVSYKQSRSADKVSSEIRSLDEQAVSLQQKIDRLGYVTAVPDEVNSRRALATEALVGDIDWTGLLERLGAAMPSSVQLQSITLTKSETSTAGAGSVAFAPGTVVGGITMSAETSGGATAVAQFIDRVSQVKGLHALWVSSTTDTSGLTTLQATAQVTTAAFSTRAAALPGGSK